MIKYASISIAIVGIWIISTIAVLSRETISPLTMTLIALVNTVWLTLLGFRASRYPENK